MDRNGLNKSYLDNDMKHSDVINRITSSVGYDNGLSSSMKPNIYFDDFNNGGQSVSHNGLILAPNGSLFSIPSDDIQVLEYNPTTNVYSKFGSLPVTSSKFQGGCYSRLTGMIYLMPYILTKFYKIDPNRRTVSLINFGSIGGFYSTLIEAPNGMLYALPRDDANSVIEFNPLTETYRTVGPTLSFGGGWAQGILGDDGMIYGVPYTYTSNFCRFNPSTFETTIVGSSDSTRSANLPKYYSGVMAKNKKIYCIPAYNDIIEVFDTVTYQVTRLKYSGAFSSKWWGGALGPNGKIYCTPYAASTVLEIDPNTNDGVEIIPVTTNAWGGSARNSGAILHPNGRIYMAPRTNNWPVIVDFGRINATVDICANKHINYQ